MANNKNFNKPYKIIDSRREHKIGVVANSLSELIIKAQQKLKIDGPVKVVLEIDGTEIDENDYFETLEDNTLFMILKSEEKWCPYSAISIKIGDDHVDGTQNLYSLIERLKNDIGQITLLGGCDLELLSDMNLEDMENLEIDKSFLENIKEASGRYLAEKREAQDSLNLLKLYHASTVKQNASKKNKV